MWRLPLLTQSKEREHPTGRIGCFLLILALLVFWFIATH